MPIYTVLSPLRHDCRSYKVGNSITLDASVARPLIAAGVLSAGSEQPGPAEPPVATDPGGLSRPGSGEASPMTLREAILDLDADNPDHWTADGKPDARALADILDRKVTAAERDAAWSALQEPSV